MEYPDFNVCKVAFAYYRVYRPQYCLHMREREHNGLTLVLSGQLKLTSPDGESVIARENDIIFQHIGDSYRLEATGDTNAEYIVISYLATSPQTLDTLLPDMRIYTPEHRRRYRDAFERAARTYSAGGICSEALLRALVQQILCHIIRENYPKALCAADNPAAYAKYYMEEYFDQFLTADAIAKAAHCSLSHLRVLFKKAYGVPPMHYLNSVRVERAKEMLSSGLFRLEEIATACGFQNVYYFSRVFKSFTGISPGKY
ncbi:MAG: helix-turn-helix domain-containing protein [Clostridia bacterium]|nr:helix-turn-helix domain-containing protein [Clostridia bacterium]